MRAVVRGAHAAGLNEDKKILVQDMSCHVALWLTILKLVRMVYIVAVVPIAAKMPPLALLALLPNPASRREFTPRKAKTKGLV